MTRAEKEIRNEQMRAYKATGKTNREVAEHFGVSEYTAQTACKGIASQRANGYKNLASGQKMDKKNESTIIRRINEYADRWEYAGNYTGSDGHVDIRCVKCGTIRHTKCSMFRMRAALLCPTCESRAREERKRREQEERERIRAEQERIKAEQEAERLRLERERREARRHPCPVCGAITDRPKYCSNRCQNKVANHNHDLRRRKIIERQMVDKDITLEGLFRRDNGRCYICGLDCSWDDYTIKEGVKITGYYYPSIEHVVPLSKGGLHSWDNVRLAHRKCNNAKRNALLSDFLK
jgi:5-methylcytosine-specific restriction endonuclease McrA